ncbi:MAG: type II methionyl aminopeptidase [Candidatus Thorarchaeota archaeon]|nr:MAG: type II methionyl aminopeptidase [Candidatus Thorarchaeota archaeon]
MMDRHPHPDSVRAGQIAARVISEVASAIKPSVSVLKICHLAERKILEYGATGLAFPCNVSINEEAAHYTSPRGDKRVFPDQGLVKLDLGAHVNGYLSDTAVTVDLDGSYDRFIAASRAALDAAIEIVRPGVRVGEVGAAIERAIRKTGLRPIHQLSGHEMKPWTLHAGKTVPNIHMGGGPIMKEGEVYAIEPFATNGNGTVRSRRDAYIFSNVMSNRSRVDRLANEVRNIARRRFKTLPWASRWLKSDRYDVDAVIHTLVRAGAVRAYPVLVEGANGMVSQFEHTVFVSKNGAIVLTGRGDE